MYALSCSFWPASIQSTDLELLFSKGAVFSILPYKTTTGNNKYNSPLLNVLPITQNKMRSKFCLRSVTEKPHIDVNPPHGSFTASVVRLAQEFLGASAGVDIGVPKSRLRFSNEFFFWYCCTCGKSWHSLHAVWMRLTTLGGIMRANKIWYSRICN